MGERTNLIQTIMIMLQILGYSMSLWMYGLNVDNLVFGMSSDFLAGFFLALSLTVSIAIITKQQAAHESF